MLMRNGFPAVQTGIGRMADSAHQDRFIFTKRDRYQQMRHTAKKQEQQQFVKTVGGFIMMRNSAHESAAQSYMLNRCLLGCTDAIHTYMRA